MPPNLLMGRETALKASGDFSCRNKMLKLLECDSVGTWRAGMKSSFGWKEKEYGVYQALGHQVLFRWPRGTRMTRWQSFWHWQAVGGYELCSKFASSLSKGLLRFDIFETHHLWWQLWLCLVAAQESWGQQPSGCAMGFIPAPALVLGAKREVEMLGSISSLALMTPCLHFAGWLALG